MPNLDGLQRLELPPAVNDWSGVDLRDALQDSFSKLLPRLHPSTGRAYATKPIVRSRWEVTSCSSAARWSNRPCGIKILAGLTMRSYEAVVRQFAQA